jgi:hypothetical protein
MLVRSKFFDTAVGGALQLLGGQRREPSLHHVHPRPIGGGEVEVEPAVAQEPAVHGGGLVGGEVVEDHVHVQVFGDVAVDLVQEGDEVGAGVGLADVGDH